MDGKHRGAAGAGAVPELFLQTELWLRISRKLVRISENGLQGGTVGHRWVRSSKNRFVYKKVAIFLKRHL